MTIDHEIMDEYLSLTQNASREFRLHFGKQNLTFPQALVLSTLMEEHPVPISLLSEKTGSANSTVSGIVDRLEKLGLVRRERGKEDRRVIYVNLTEEYLREHRETSNSVREYFSGLMAPLSVEEKENILRAFRNLNGILLKDEEENR